MGSSYYNVPNPKPGVVFTYYVKDEIKKLKDIRTEAEKAKYDKGEKVYYPSIDSLRLEDNQPDPYLLFTITDSNGDVVRHIKTAAKKGIQRIHWNFRTNSAAPVNQRYTPGPDQLFGSEEQGYLVLPGTYNVTLHKYQDGELTTLAGPVSFSCKMLNNTTLPADNMNENEAFYKKLTDIRKEMSATEDVVANLENRLKNINLAILDMPAPTKELLKQAYNADIQLDKLKLELFGDGTKSKREFETNASVSDRIYGAIGSVWNTTANIPTTYKSSFDIASKQFKQSLSTLKTIHEKVQGIEKELDMKKAPFSPGRWPNW